MPKPIPQVIEFLISQADPAVLDAYALLADLEYPIADYRALTQQLAGLRSGDDRGRRAAAALVTDLVDPRDMPMASAQGALEKFDARLSRPTLTIPRGTARPRLHPSDVNRICAAQAQEAYDEAIARGATPAEALQAYLDALARCQGYYSAGWAKDLRRFVEDLFDPR